LSCFQGTYAFDAEFDVDDVYVLDVLDEPDGDPVRAVLHSFRSISPSWLVSAFRNARIFWSNSSIARFFASVTGVFLSLSNSSRTFLCVSDLSKEFLLVSDVGDDSQEVALVVDATSPDSTFCDFLGIPSLVVPNFLLESRSIVCSLRGLVVLVVLVALLRILTFRDGFGFGFS
jgi:hypothetical protein